MFYNIVSMQPKAACFNALEEDVARPQLVGCLMIHVGVPQNEGLLIWRPNDRAPIIKRGWWPKIRGFLLRVLVARIPICWRVWSLW